ncbi:hypothetical protein DH2020_039222 [Rehmannia glutinosa]|uniref:Clp R domain-containing protein n=1 Tax=Rehmannia glutinosa TaxID=99300 RepID=A0ABR0UWG8_REHGL
MRAGLSTIQQTLTPEAATVLSQSIAEASRRNHGQTTPLHVAATLLAAPSGYLRQACIRSHPNSSHPLQCRALELCFSVALERLPTAQNAAAPGMEPPISNALMAALKRAQAHQRRGCPEQQQQPLLAVKVELDQLIISILDDPSVSRVMREAGFSSPAVKATIEQSSTSSTSHGHHHHHHHLMLCNPVISMEKGLLSDTNHVRAKIKELGDVIESRIGIGGVILDLGDLKWIVEQQHQQQGISENGRMAVVEMAKLLARFNEDNNKVWLIGTATCETYLRCQVYHSTMENDWDLQAVPMASRSPMPGCFRENYEKELEKLAAIEKSFNEAQPSLPQWLQNAKLNTTDAKIADRSQEKNQGVISKQKIQELQKKWRDTCLHLHPNFHQTSRADRISPPTLSMTSLYDTNLLGRPIFQPTLLTAKPVGEILQLNPNKVTNSPPASPVRTDLVLGRKRTESTPEKFTHDDQAKEFLGYICSEPRPSCSISLLMLWMLTHTKNSLKGSWRKHGGRPKQPLRWPQPLRVAD